MKTILPISLILLSLIAGCGRFEREIRISESEIQSRMSAKFPKDFNAVVARLTLSNPVTYLNDTKIGMKLNYYGNYLDREIEGLVDFNGVIYYKPETGGFYLTDFEIKEIQVSGTRVDDFDRLETIILNIVDNYLDSYPIYRLNQGDFKQSLAKMLMKDVYVDGDELVIKIGL